MALEGQITSVANASLNIGKIIVVMLLGLGTVAGLGWLLVQWQKFGQFRCVIWSKDAFGHIRETYDKAGIFVDSRTKNKRFFMRKGKAGLDPDNVPVVYNKKGKAIVYLYKSGEKNFSFLKPKINENNFSLEVTEEDINWALNDYQKAKIRFEQSKLLQFMPYIALAFVSIIILVIFIYFFKDFDVLVQVANSLREAAIEIGKAKMNSTII